MFEFLPFRKRIKEKIEKLEKEIEDLKKHLKSHRHELISGIVYTEYV